MLEVEEGYGCEGKKCTDLSARPTFEESFYEEEKIFGGSGCSLEASDPPDNTCEKSVVPVATTDASFDESNFPITVENDTKPKKAKKRVGRIGFADVMVSEQVIKNTAEDLEMRRDLWRAIQDKADNPNSVFSNESSKSTSRAPSVHGSPEIKSQDDPTLQLDSDPLILPLVENPTLNFHLLNEQLLTVLKGVEQNLDSDDLDPQHIEVSSTSATIEDNDKNALYSGDVDDSSAERNKSLENHESKGSDSDPGGLVMGSECLVLGTVSELKSVVPPICQVQTDSDESNIQETENDNKSSRILAESANSVPETDDRTLPLSDVAIKIKHDQEKLQEPLGVGCPLLDFPDLNSYISQKQEHDFFSDLSQALLVYIDLWPKARKAPRNGIFPPRDTKTSKDFAYALQRWLVRTWHSGLKLQNSYHIGILMHQDKDLLHGQNPLIEKNLVSKLENDHELSVQLTAVADITVDDWIEISDRFKNRHLIGGNFFPSDEYSVLSGLDALSTSQVSMEGDAQGDADVVRGSDDVVWEADSSIGLPVDFSAKTDHAAWDAPYPLMLTGQGVADDQRNTEKVDIPAQHEENLKRGRLNGHSQTDATSRKPVPAALSRRQGLEFGRAISEPLPRSSRRIRGDDGAKLRRPATSELRADQTRNKSNISEKEKKLESDLDFLRFTKSKTGRTRLSQQKLDMLKFAYRDDLLHRRKVQAAKTVSMLLADAGDSLVRRGTDSSGTSESGKTSHLPRGTADPSRHQSGMCTAKLKEKMDTGKSSLSAIESAFSKKIKADEHLGIVNMESCDSSDRYSDAEVNIDEFLREPMCKMLTHDNVLAKSLNLTGFGEVDVKQPLVSNHRNPWRQQSSQQTRVGALQSVGHQEAHHGPSTRLPDLRNRAAIRPEHQTPLQTVQSSGQRCDGLLKNMQLVRKPFPERRSAQSALGYLDHHPPLGDLVKSPYAQRVRGSFTAYRMSKQCAHKNRAAQAVV